MNPLYSVNLIEEKGKHFYTIGDDKTWLPGVTGVLDNASKPALVPWAAKVVAEYMREILGRMSHTERWLNGRYVGFEPDFLDLFVKRAKKQPRFIKESAARTGTKAHGVFDALLKGTPPADTSPNLLKSFDLWRWREPLKFVQGDTKVASKTFGYGGSVDGFLQDKNGKIVIVDFKTSKGIWPEYAYQVGGGYAQATKETYGLDYLPKGIIVRFEKEKVGFERREINFPETCWKGFKALLDFSKIQALDHFQNRILVRPIKND